MPNPLLLDAPQNSGPSSDPLKQRLLRVEIKRKLTGGSAAESAPFLPFLIAAGERSWLTSHTFGPLRRESGHAAPAERPRRSLRRGGGATRRWRELRKPPALPQRSELTWLAERQNLPPMDPDDLPIRAPGDLIAAVGRQDLDPLSVAELHARIAALEAEIARSREKIEAAVNHRATAEGLFRR